MITELKQMTYLEKVAKKVFDKFGGDFYEALNVAECICRSWDGDVDADASRVYAILEGEL